MATGILSENPTAINPQIDHHDTFLGHLSKIQAMVDVALSDHFLESSRETVHDYLWILSDLLPETRKLGEKLIIQSVSLQKGLGESCKHSG